MDLVKIGAVELSKLPEELKVLVYAMKALGRPTVLTFEGGSAMTISTEANPPLVALRD